MLFFIIAGFSWICYRYCQDCSLTMNDHWPNLNQAIGLMSRVFANGPRNSGDLGSILGRVMPKTQKTVLYAALLNTQQYKVRIKGKV